MITFSNNGFDGVHEACVFRWRSNLCLQPCAYRVKGMKGGFRNKPSPCSSECSGQYTYNTSEPFQQIKTSPTQHICSYKRVVALNGSLKNHRREAVGGEQTAGLRQLEDWLVEEAACAISLQMNILPPCLACAKKTYLACTLAK